MTSSLFGDRLRALRTEKGLSLQTLADCVEVSKAHLWYLEQGKSSNPSLSLLTQLSRALDVPICVLAGEADQAVTEQDKQLMSLFRELRNLSADDVELIQTLTTKLWNRAIERRGE